LLLVIFIGGKSYNPYTFYLTELQGLCIKAYQNHKQKIDIEVFMIAKKVKKLMIDRGLTITALAEITGYSRSHISNVINGRVGSSTRIKKAIALALVGKRAWDKEK